MSKLIEVEYPEESLAVVILNDPTTRNAMSEAMSHAFKATVEELRSQRKLRVVMFRGAGKAFSGGGHLDMLAEKMEIDQEKNRILMEEFYHSFLSLRSLEVPTIAAINGHAVGAGLCFALACDIRVAIESAKLGLNFVHLGLHPGMGATYFLPRLVGPANAAYLLYTGRIVSAAEAVQLGLVNKVFDEHSFEAEAAEIARSICAAGPESVRMLKRSLREGENRTLEQCLQREAECQALNYASAEFREGITAAREKRKPAF